MNAFKDNPEKQHQAYKNHKMLIYFHGNAEDIGHSYDFLNQISDMFHVSIHLVIHYAFLVECNFNGISRLRYI